MVLCTFNIMWLALISYVSFIIKTGPQTKNLMLVDYSYGIYSISILKKL